MAKFSFKAKDFGKEIGQVVVVLDSEISKYQKYFKKEDGFKKYGKMNFGKDCYSVYSNQPHITNDEVSDWISKDLKLEASKMMFANYSNTFKCVEMKD